jgi:Fe2+ transport system protein B
VRLQLTYQHTLVQEFNVDIDVDWLAGTLGLSVDELLALDGAGLDARLKSIHYAMVNDPNGGEDYEREFSSFLREQFEEGDLYEDDEAEG